MLELLENCPIMLISLYFVAEEELVKNFQKNVAFLGISVICLVLYYFFVKKYPGRKNYCLGLALILWLILSYLKHMHF